MVTKKAKAVKPQTAQEIVDIVRKIEENKILSKDKRTLAKQIMLLMKERDAMLSIKSAKSSYKISPSRSEGGEAVAVMVISDLHIEEVVKFSQTSGLNEYNEKVCKERMQRLFRHALKLVQKEQKATRIDTLCMAILGDIISGSIHEELLEGNRKLPIDAIIEAQEHLTSGIQYILDNSDLKLVIPCVSGN